MSHTDRTKKSSIKLMLAIIIIGVCHELMNLSFKRTTGLTYFETSLH